MNEGEGGKVTGIRHIVRLRELLQRWHNLSLSKKEPAGSAISPAMSQRLRSSYIICDSDEESCHSPEPPPDVPKGYLAVYIGPELRRFIIPTSYLSLPVFKALLEKAEEEFGFDHKGALTIPCEIETFKYILQCIEHNPNNLENGGPSSLDDAQTGLDQAGKLRVVSVSNFFEFGEGAVQRQIGEMHFSEGSRNLNTEADCLSVLKVDNTFLNKELTEKSDGKACSKTFGVGVGVERDRSKDVEPIFSDGNQVLQGASQGIMARSCAGTCIPDAGLFSNENLFCPSKPQNIFSGKDKFLDIETGPPGFDVGLVENSDDNSIETVVHAARMIREKLGIQIQGTGKADKAFGAFCKNRKLEVETYRKKSVVPDVSINLRKQVGKRGLSHKVESGRKKNS